MVNHKENFEIAKGSFFDIHNVPLQFEIRNYYAMNFDFFEMEPHMHKEFEIMYVVSGSCKVICWMKGDSREEWILKEGEYVFVDCNVMHQLEVARGSKCRILNLEISIQSKRSEICLAELIECSKSLQDFLHLPIKGFKGYDDTGNLHTIITELHKQLQNTIDESEHRIMQTLLLAQLIIEMGRQSAKKHHAESGSKYVRKALTYLSNNFEQDIKISDIAEKIRISAAYLQRLFKEQVGITLVDKINELRIEKAKILLETSSLPIMDIAVSVGFNNRQHFSYTFQKLVGSSPALYRKHKGDYRVWSRFEKE